jgi:predicted RNA-binding Zn-ribbon protein involved in translation (DUF1610 family)
MRLIDADELVDRLVNAPCKVDESLHYAFINAMLMYVNQSPTVEPPSGEWIISESEESGAVGIRYKSYECPFCGWDNSLIIPRNFCPKCGARLKEVR